LFHTFETFITRWSGCLSVILYELTNS